LPTGWQVQTAPASTGPWTNATVLSGAATGYTALAAALYIRMWGVDGGLNQVSDISNVVGPTT